VVIKPSSSTVLVLALWGLALPGAGLHAQLEPVGPHLRNSAYIGIGYVTNVPNTFVGFNLLGLTPKLLGGAGLYADVKFTTSSPGSQSSFLEGVSVEQAEITFGDQLFEQKSDWLSFNVALVYAVTPELALYGGAGYAKETAYKQYFDNSEIRGEFGFYWIEDPANSGNRVNVLGGGFIRLARFLLFQVGAEAQPLGATLGLTFTFALR
jgi:hypothetical protein